jgi:NHL repeat
MQMTTPPEKTVATETRTSQRWFFTSLTLALAIGAVALPFLTASAEAAPPQIWQKCDSDEPAGQQCNAPRGIAANPQNGHVYVADSGNRRVVEFNALGAFVRAWGWDVVESGPGNTGSAFEICVPEDGDVCKAGVSGSGAGQFAVTSGVAVDSAGDVYVVDKSDNRRVQKFDSQGHFLRTWGKDVNSGISGDPDLCTNVGAPTDVCQGGVEGTGPGQFGAWEVGSFIAVDSNGTGTVVDDEVWVGDQNRIQRFDTEGAYQGEIALPGETVLSLAVDDTGDLYATYRLGESSPKENVRKLDPDSPAPATPVREFPVKVPTAVAVDSEGSVYVFDQSAVQPTEPTKDRPPVLVFDAEGKKTDEFGKDEFNASTGLATNLCAGSEAPGNLYVTGLAGFYFGGASVRAYGTAPLGCLSVRTTEASGIEETTATLNGEVNPRGAAVSECRFEYGPTAAYGSTAPCLEAPAEIGTGTGPVPVHADLSGLSPGTVQHFRLLARVSGATEKGEDETFKTLGPPAIGGEHTASVTFTEATLRGRVNPEGFPTSYRFQYVDQASFEAEGFANPQQTPSPPIGSDRAEHSAIANLSGLVPGTTYHWRILATNTALQNGGLTVGQERSFATYRLPAPQTDCPNQALRTDAAAFLPDCRAYEMVSPIDKNGGDIVASTERSAGEHFAYNQASLDGSRITYTVSPAFADQPASFYFNQYLAGRTASGWGTSGINNPVAKPPPGSGFYGLLRYYGAFSADLCGGWLWVQGSTPLLTSESQEGFNNLYRRDLCGEGGYETVTDVLPASGTGSEYVNQTSIQGASEDSRHFLFTAEGALTPDAATGTNKQVYDRFEGGVHLVSVLPPGEADPANAVVGSGIEGNLDRAVSNDGSRVYWTSGTGKIYLREHPEQGIVGGECSEAGIACTTPVSTSNALFWTAASDGSAALYSEGNLGNAEASLHEFSVQGPPRVIAAHVKGVAGASEDLSRIYFVSTEALTGPQENSEGDTAQAGEPNLYLDEEGTLSFVATLLEIDVGATKSIVPAEAEAEARVYNVVSALPRLRASRVTPDGGRIVFESRAPLSGYDNVDPANGEPLIEIFTYEAGGELECLSCNPAGASPSGREQPITFAYPRESLATNVYASGWIPAWENPLHASRVVSDNGGRVFFHSYEALLPRDANGAMDVYEWEEPGVGSCTEESPNFFAENGGCIELISTGESSFESEFWDASADGSDVFFTTESSLVPQDPGSIDIYDARVGGGFAQHVQPPECEGEACQSPPAPPDDPTPASAAFQGAGNVNEASTTSRCPKGKRKVRRKGKARCVASHKKRGKRGRANSKRRAER